MITYRYLWTWRNKSIFEGKFHLPTNSIFCCIKRILFSLVRSHLPRARSSSTLMEHVKSILVFRGWVMGVFLWIIVVLACLILSVRLEVVMRSMLWYGECVSVRIWHVGEALSTFK